MENENNQQARSSNMMKGVLIGGAIGAAAAVLMTPKSGKEMRETIRRKSTELSTAARERAATLADQAKEKAGDVGVMVNEIGRTAANKVASAAEQTANVFQSMKRAEEGVNSNVSSTGTNGASHERSQP
ncbi:YtxH domain-containing protein [Paenibacillus sp. sptzw28]|uniref:YtxH domain-containing protein n=1 Tax=Paenibacillus sp. sptzw28 TaxID=715179 RepID=UPI001C6E587C|nr:YtxH domain-containing protein [Paenibacillus sp. sptzw28]QYR20584.1 YtxH domain-containing protein [Paenibacillus sp. sptzw28]